MSKNEFLELYYKKIKIRYILFGILNIFIFIALLTITIVFWKKWDFRHLGSFKVCITFFSMISWFLTIIFLIVFGWINAWRIKNGIDEKKELGYKYFLSLFTSVQKIKIIFPKTDEILSLEIFISITFNSFATILWLIPYLIIFILIKIIFIPFEIKINKEIKNIKIEEDEIKSKETNKLEQMKL